VFTAVFGRERAAIFQFQPTRPGVKCRELPAFLYDFALRSHLHSGLLCGKGREDDGPVGSASTDLMPHKNSPWGILVAIA
jgi:hypothetical protein